MVVIAWKLGDDEAVPNRIIWDLYYAEERSSGWEVETVEQILSFNSPQGVDFTIALPDDVQARVKALLDAAVRDVEAELNRA